jgi:putative phosphoribosyl transferase
MNINRNRNHQAVERDVSIQAGDVVLEGTLCLPEGAQGIVLFAHGSGSSRHSPRNQFVAQVLQSQGIATLLFDLLTRDEDFIDQQNAELRFDIPLLAQRLVGATRWILAQPATRELRLGYFGASTGAAAALVAATELPAEVGAIVSRGGRPDLAGDALGTVVAPTLLIVGQRDRVVIGLNRQAYSRMRCPLNRIVLVPGATHLFEEPGTLEAAAQLAADWFSRHLIAVPQTMAEPAMAHC